MAARRSPTTRVSLAFVCIAGVSLLAADLEVTTLSPWTELGRMVGGILSPDFGDLWRLSEALFQTLIFAFAGTSLAFVLGFPLALAFRWAPVRAYTAVVRSVHELFWALLFLQAVGLNPWCGVLAIAVPYSGILAKVLAEILEEADPRPLNALPPGTGALSAFFFVRLPDVWGHVKHYAGYRLECALRSSAILGFVGFPTLGFYLHTAFQEGLYGEVAALLLLFYAVIASLKYWVRPRLTLVYSGVALITLAILPGSTRFVWANLERFLTRDIVPAPIRGALHEESLAVTDHLPALWVWLERLIFDQALPGLMVTLLLAQIALVTTGLMALVALPWLSKQFVGRPLREVNRLGGIILRSTPEYILAFTFLLLWGPSWLPAIMALAIHNGAIIAHLLSRHADALPLRADAPHGMNRFAYETVPRLYGQFLAYLFYRWEIILRETAILGILGIHTLGFYIDSALADDRQDRALVLIAVTALLNLAVEAVSRRIRARLRLRTTPEAL